MDFNYFIIGEKYNISALAIEGSFAGKKYAVFKLPTGRTFLLRAEDFEAVSPANGIKNTENAPKYDPNRKFRKGDIVEMDTHGRDVAASLKKAGIELGKRYTVTEGESNTGHNTGYVSFIGDDGIEHRAMFFWLKLVTPVEELEPYIVVDAHTHWDVAEKNMKTVAMYSKGNHPHAKEAAEAERDRLNAEWRKEQE